MRGCIGSDLFYIYIYLGEKFIIWIFMNILLVYRIVGWCKWNVYVKVIIEDLYIIFSIIYIVILYIEY